MTVKADRLRSDVNETASEVRRFLEPLWWEWRDANGWLAAGPMGPDTPVSTGMCHLSSAFLFNVLTATYPAVGWYVAKGIAQPDCDDSRLLGSPSARRPGGLRDLAGAWFDHAWVEGRIAGVGDAGRVIVDVTADQMGHDPVVVIRKPDPRYRRNCRIDAVHAEIAQLTDVGRWMAEWRERQEQHLSPPL